METPPSPVHERGRLESRQAFERVRGNTDCVISGDVDHPRMREGDKRDLARRLRAELTPHERRLWTLLRDRRFAGEKFRRQVCIGPYIADFASVSRKIVIELDGGQHSENARDMRRDGYLRSRGWTVLRFWNNELMENREGVLLKIAEHLA